MDPDELAPDANLWADIWLYIRYHLLTKTLMVVTIIPTFTWLVDWVIGSMGREVISRDDYLALAFSPQGIALAVLGVVLVMAAIATDIAAFIIMEATRLIRGQLPGARQTLFAAMRSIAMFARPSTVLLLGYLTLIVPLSGVGLTIGPFRDVALPVEYQETINQNPAGLWLYYAALATIVITGVFLVFTFHYVILTGQTPWQGMVHSACFVWSNGKTLAFTMVKRTGIFALQIGAVVLVITLVYTTLRGIDLSEQVRRFMLLIFLLLAFQANGIVLFILLPMQVRNLTRMFIAFREPACLLDTHTSTSASPAGNGQEHGQEPHNQQHEACEGAQRVATQHRHGEPPLVTTFLPNPCRPPRLAPQLVVGTIVLLDLLANGIGAYRTAIDFENVFVPRERVTVVSTPDGEGMAHPNTLTGIEEALDLQLDWLLISTRLLPSNELALNDNESLHQALDLAKGRLNLLIVLPDGADLQSVTTLYGHIDAADMVNQVIVASTQNAVLNDAETHHPLMRTAFISELSVGDFSKISADAIVIEEFERHQNRVSQAREAGKAIFIRSLKPAYRLGIEAHHDIHGIITPHPLALRTQLRAQEGKSDWDLIVESLSLT